jgi:hypothetical protein
MSASGAKYVEVPAFWWQWFKSWRTDESGTKTPIASSSYHKHLPHYLTIGTSKPPPINLISLWCTDHSWSCRTHTRSIVTPNAHTQSFSYHGDSPTTRLRRKDFGHLKDFFGCGKSSAVWCERFSNLWRWQSATQTPAATFKDGPTRLDTVH